MKKILITLFLGVFTKEFRLKYPHTVPPSEKDWMSDEYEGDINALETVVTKVTKGFADWIAVNKYMPVHNNWQLTEPEWFNPDLPSKTYTSQDLFPQYIKSLENGK